MKKKFLSLALATILTMALSVPAFAATPIDIDNTPASFETDTLNKTTGTTHFADNDNYDGPQDAPTNVWNNGTIKEEVKVTAVKTADFTITIPKEITMDGDTRSANYTVNVKGDIAGDQKITVTPDASFNLAETGGKADVPTTVTQDDVTFLPTDIYYGVAKDQPGKTVDGKLEASTLSAGQWSGKFNFTIVYGAQ